MGSLGDGDPALFCTFRITLLMLEITLEIILSTFYRMWHDKSVIAFEFENP